MTPSALDASRTPHPTPLALFSADWLERREALDARSRSRALTGLAADWLSARRGPHEILDLGSGSGSNLRFLAPRLPGPQHWRLVDHDAGLLAMARQRAAGLRDRGGEGVSLVTRRRDLEPVDEELVSGADLVVASALFDLASRSWVDALVGACARRRQALLFTLSVDGDWGFLNTDGERADDGEDVAVCTLFQAHQLRDKGMGSALGGEAPAVLTGLLTQAGYRVASRATPWHLAPGERACLPLAEALVDGWFEAARQQAPAEAPRLLDWRQRRLAGLAGGELGIVVGHRDLLALPSSTRDGA